MIEQETYVLMKSIFQVHQYMRRHAHFGTYVTMCCLEFAEIDVIQLIFSRHRLIPTFVHPRCKLTLWVEMMLSV